ncbi:MAG: DUF6331 family protein [Planctomycetes bacterium]|nr:DUF6331 family protein [Planctomycetota bacterium]
MSSRLPVEVMLRLPDPLMRLVRNCEVICVAGCCGLGAFERDSRHLLPWFREHPDQFMAIVDQLSEVIRFAGDQKGVIASDPDDFNSSWEPHEFVQFLTEWRQTILEAAEKVFGQSLPTLEPQWLTSTVTQLTQGIYDDRAFDRLPILADALQDAGCDNADVLNHCRENGPHARGCWVVDMVLGKQ